VLASDLSKAPVRVEGSGPWCDADGVHLPVAAEGHLGLRVTRLLDGGGSIDWVQRRIGTAPLLDATVRFGARPATYAYRVEPLAGGGPATSASVTCTGPAAARPPAGSSVGVVEGFYGRPWTWPEREKLVRAMGALGLRTYLYAPKNDPKHRDRWREPYDSQLIARFARLASLGTAVGVEVVYAVSPGADIDAGSTSDFEALEAKVEAMRAQAGIRDAALLMDDLDPAAHPHSRVLGEQHAALASKLLASMRGRDGAARLWFVPTVYAGLADKLPQADRDYLDALAAMPADIPIAWTGDAVFAKRIEVADATAFASLAGRAASGLWVWDNYPVNDIALFRRLFARPVEGRESLLPGVSALVSNPMRHALASIPAIASYAELAIDPAAYAADRASGKPLREAALALALADAEGFPGALEDLMRELVHHDTIWPGDPASAETTAAIGAYLAAPQVGAGRRVAARALAERLARIAVVDVELRRGLADQALADELDAHARTAAGLARAALATMGAHRAALLGDAERERAARRRAACAASALNVTAWRSIHEALRDLLSSADAVDCAGEPDPFGGASPVRTEAGRAWCVGLADALREPGAGWVVGSPSTASVTPQGKLCWTPDAPGRKRIVAFVAGDAGVSAEVYDLVVASASVVPAEPGPVVESVGGGCGCGLVGAGGGAGGIATLGAGSILVLLGARRATRDSTRRPARPDRRGPCGSARGPQYG
jgi:hyaluronoglucosaminidase